VKRTHLPLNALRVFDAAARHLSFTRAADELAVTPAAVGQQIRALEDALGVVLFRRTAKGLELTPEAARGLDALRKGFLQFEESVRAMQEGQSSKTLTIAAPRDFTAKWLAPRLARFSETDSETRFVLIAADSQIDFTEANLDLAIGWMSGPGEHEGARIADGAMVAVGDGPRIAWPGDGLEGEEGLSVGDAGLALDAAIAGLGRARVPALLAEADIAAGRIGDGERQAVDSAYWLVAPLPQWRQKKVKALVAALTGKA